MSLLSRLRKLEGATADWRAAERDACATCGYPRRAAHGVILRAPDADEPFPRCPACDRRLVPQHVVRHPGEPSPAGRPLSDRPTIIVLDPAGRHLQLPGAVDEPFDAEAG